MSMLAYSAPSTVEEAVRILGDESVGIKHAINGILSLILNTTQPATQYSEEEQRAVVHSEERTPKRRDERNRIALNSSSPASAARNRACAAASMAAGAVFSAAGRRRKRGTTSPRSSIAYSGSACCESTTTPTPGCASRMRRAYHADSALAAEAALTALAAELDRTQGFDALVGRIEPGSDATRRADLVYADRLEGYRQLTNRGRP